MQIPFKWESNIWVLKKYEDHVALHLRDSLIVQLFYLYVDRRILRHRLLIGVCCEPLNTVERMGFYYIGVTRAELVQFSSTDGVHF
ncbi:hypothetical protein CSKR_202847 [Clonorchis sinensis]|uniref:Uncharacterized protein n=1 Tax=Clonorchis sinensis TaxID=79923 RepID=A0A8T1M3H9_CLOSI|nr:hypothetical protein CSKR_202847 [Clonorchis sinensis]